MPGRIINNQGPGILLFFLLIGGLYPAYGIGKPEEAPVEPLNKEWIFCVTAFDASALPPSRQVIGEVMAANLAEALGGVDRRFRVSEEYTYYEGTAMARARAEAAKKVAAKRNERDQAVFRGNADWKLKKDLAALEKDILKLEEDYHKVEEAVPVIEEKPVFTLNAANREGTFPAPPAAAGEYRFCVKEKVDGFLTGQVSEFHGRIYAQLRLYSLYTRSYRYEDSAIFSPEDIGSAMEELADRLAGELTGTRRAAVAVHAQPKDALVLINRTFAGRGETDVQERSPGTVEVSVSAENHETVTMPLELAGGELAELFVNLDPLDTRLFTLDVPGKPGSLLYLGALYAGETPFTLTLPENQAEYVTVETPDGETGGAVVWSGISTPNVALLTLAPPKGQQVFPAREGFWSFYGAYGRFWVAFPVAFLVNGLYSMYRDTYMRPESLRNPDLYRDASTLYYASMGATAVAGVFLAESLGRMLFYVYKAGKYQPKLAK